MTEETLFALALEKVAGPERQAFLDAACGGDATLRERVERLLDSDKRASGILDHGPDPVTSSARRVEGELVHPPFEPRLRHFEKKKDAAGCRATAEMWERLNRTDADSLYDAACFRAVTTAALREADGSAEGAKGADAEADRAKTWLGKAVAATFSDIEHLKRERDLDALRGRANFK